MLRSIGARVGPLLRATGVRIEAAGKLLGEQVGAPLTDAPPAYIGFRPLAGPLVEEVQVMARDAASKEVVEVPTKFVAPNASVSQDAKIEEGSSVWYGAVVAGSVSLAPGASVLEHAAVEGANNKPTVIGAGTTISPRSKVGPGVTVGNNCVIGAGAVVESGATVADGAVVSQGSHVASGTKIGSRELWAGNPAVLVRSLEASELSVFAERAQETSRLALLHQAEANKDMFQLFAERRVFEDRTEWAEDVLEDRPQWDTYVNIEMAPDLNPERRGLLYDKQP